MLSEMQRKINECFYFVYCQEKLQRKLNEHFNFFSLSRKDMNKMEKMIDQRFNKICKVVTNSKQK